MTTVTQSRRPEPARRAPFRLRGRTRKTVLILHILSVGTWVGVDVIVAVLVLTGWLSSDPSVQGLAYEALGTFVVWPMLVSGLVGLVTGVILGLGSKYGLVRYWWVAVKLVLNVVLCTLILVALQPEARRGRPVRPGPGRRDGDRAGHVRPVLPADRVAVRADVRHGPVGREAVGPAAQAQLGDAPPGSPGRATAGRPPSVH